MSLLSLSLFYRILLLRCLLPSDKLVSTPRSIPRYCQGNPYIPMVVRVGPNVKEALLDVALDTMAKQRMLEGGEGTTHEAARLAVLNDAQVATPPTKKLGGG